MDDQKVHLLLLSVQLTQWHDLMNWLHTSNPIWENNESSVYNNKTAKLFTKFPSYNFTSSTSKHQHISSMIEQKNSHLLGL